jgi:hypothetical protein
MASSARSLLRATVQNNISQNEKCAHFSNEANTAAQKVLTGEYYQLFRPVA